MRGLLVRGWWHAAVLLTGLLLAACATTPAPGEHPARQGATAPARASSNPFCGGARQLSAREQDRVLQFANVVRRELEHVPTPEVAIIGRSGLDLHRFGLRYSHGGVLLRSGTGVPWSVRQLYYDCALGRPRLYDQGLAGYLLAAEAPDLAFVSLILLPERQARAVRRAALDRELVTGLLAGRYSANAYPYSTRYQNCNQWTAELLAGAWGELPADEPHLRERAQRWLAAQGYAPQPVHVGSHLVKFVASLMPLIHLDDHPPDDQLGLDFRFSLPPDIEAFVRARAPGARRVEFCHDHDKVVVRRGWRPLGQDCEAGAGDEVVLLQD